MADEKRGRGRPKKPAGSCACCSSPREPGRSRCRPCLDKAAAYFRERADAGICRCGSRIVAGRRACQECLVKSSAERRRRYAERKQRGVCARLGCRKKAAKDRVYCKACLATISEASMASRRRRIERLKAAAAVRATAKRPT
jgi:hypothetical protein